MTHTRRMTHALILFVAIALCAVPLRAQEAAVPITWYAVPAISAIPRLPDTRPTDGVLGGPVQVVVARGEFEPASFVAVASLDLDAATLRVSDLRGPGGVLSSDAVDLRVVACWYQAGTAWSSYFADRHGKRLTPELLLKDESLIRVDPTTRDNYLRVDEADGSRYVWISYPARAATSTFNFDLAPVADSETLQPVTLKAGQGKQFWLTVRPPPDTVAGLYTGTVSIASATGDTLAEIPLLVRVLPFELPAPKTYYDLDATFYTVLYNQDSLYTHVVRNGGDVALAERQMQAIMANWRDHNLLSPLVNGAEGRRPELLSRQLTMMKESGLTTQPIFGVIHAFAVYSYLSKGDNQTDHPEYSAYTRIVDGLIDTTRKALGHNEIFAMGWDEPTRRTLVGERSSWRYVHELGASVAGTSKPWHFDWAAHNEDFSAYGGFMADQADSVRQWHAVGGRVGNYAGPHTGPENPDYIRRSHGLTIYKYDLDATFNYIYYLGPSNIWNDFESTATYRCFNLVYPTREGVIDTLAWEGFREAIDDIRYATLLRQLATKALADGSVDRRYAAKKALACLAAADAATVDLDTIRLEMVRHILTLMELSGDAE